VVWALGVWPAVAAAAAAAVVPPLVAIVDAIASACVDLDEEIAEMLDEEACCDVVAKLVWLAVLQSVLVSVNWGAVELAIALSGLVAVVVLRVAAC
jgi:hypothetical protein